MIISNVQLAQINGSFLDAYLTEASGFLSGKYPNWAATLNPEHILAFIRTGIKHAGRYNLDAKSEVTAYLEYCILFGSRFEEMAEHEWAAQILFIRNIPGSEKLHRLLEQHPL